MGLCESDIIMTILFGLFLIAHGLIHLLYFASPDKPGKHWPFDGKHSWLLSRLGVPAPILDIIAKSLAVMVAVGLTFAGLGGIGIPFPDALWHAVGEIAASVGLFLLLLYFDIQLILGIGLNLVILAVLLKDSF
jgi:hypothetical protein